MIILLQSLHFLKNNFSDIVVSFVCYYLYYIKTNKEFISDANDSENYVRFLMPYTQTSLFIGECINLEMTLVNGLIKLTEKAGNFKDRYSSLSYGNWVISQFDKNLLKETEESDDWSELMGVTQVY